MPVVRLPSGLELFHRIAGDGEALLLVAGTGADHTFWGAQVPACRRRYRTVTYDARGTGRSGKPAEIEGYTTATLADDAAGLLDALGIEVAHVSGLSLGSAVAQEMALRHPDRVRSLQLHGTWGRADEPFLAMLDRLEDLADREDWVGLARLMMETGMTPAFRGDRPIEAERLAAAHVIANRYPPTREGILGHLHADRHHDTLDRLGAISCPTLVTAGENDRQLPPRYGRAVAERIPGADFHLFRGPRSGHLVHFEMRDEFDRVTLDWLESIISRRSSAS
jgi:pimeloyl-ACP methyl ester carboxylesterase